MSFPVTRRFELAVHLRTTTKGPHLKNWIVSSGGLVHPTLAIARQVAKRIAGHADVHFVNVSEVTVQSRGLIRS